MQEEDNDAIEDLYRKDSATTAFAVAAASPSRYLRCQVAAQAQAQAEAQALRRASQLLADTAKYADIAAEVIEKAMKVSIRWRSSRMNVFEQSRLVDGVVLV